MVVKLEPSPLWAPSEDAQLEVTAHDETHNMAVPASAAWIMHGEAAAAAVHVGRRVGAVLSANPWLAARCTKEKRWVHPRDLTGTITSGLLSRHVRDGSAALSDNSFIDVLNALQPFVVRNANELAGTMGPAFLVSVVRDAGQDGRFALVLSLNHVLGDGATMYALAGMLSGGDEHVRPLSAARHAGFAHAQEQVVGKVEKGMFSFKHAGFLTGLIGSLVADLWRGSPRDVLVSCVDDAWLAEQKERAATSASVPFVSTNDILTSLLFSELIPARVGLLEVNLRGRVPDLLPATADDAGNYTVMAPFFRGDADTAADVRRSLRTEEGGHFVARRHKGTKVPGFVGMVSGPGRYVAVSYWASLDVPVSLPGCETMVHLPMMNVLMASPFDGACIWRPSPGSIGLLVFSRMKGLLPAHHKAYGRQILRFQQLHRDAHLSVTAKLAAT
jgi:hypothetical protein